MSKSKKRVAAVLSAVMLGSTLLAACSSSEGEKNNTGNSAAGNEINREGFPIVNEKINLTLMAPDVGIQNWNDMAVMKQMEEMTNVSFTYNNAAKESFDTKKNLVFSSGEYPDIFFAAGLTAAEQMNYGEQGILVPLEDLIAEYAPNIQKILDDNPEVRKSITAPDGHIYALPAIDFNQPWYRNPMWYNGEFLEKLGITEVPKTTEELYTFLKRVKEEDPNGNGQADEIPLSSVNLRDIRTWLLGAFGIYEEELYFDDNNVVHYTPLEDGYKEFLIYLNRLWAEDLLDHETFSQTAEQKKAKAQNNQVALFSDWHAYMTLGGEPDMSDVMFAPVASDMVDKPVIARNRGLNIGAFAISESNKHPEASIRWVDYLYTFEGAMLFNKGPEGDLWAYTDKENKKFRLLPSDKTDEYRATLTPAYGIPVPMINSDEMREEERGEFDQWVDNESKTKLLDQGARIPFPLLFLTAEEQAEVSMLSSDLNTYVRQMEAKFITGAEPITNWDNYISTVKKMGGDRMQEIHQAAYDRWNTGAAQ